MSLAISYIRFSSNRQEEGSSFQRQYEQTRAYCLKHNLDLAAEEFYDLGVSAFRSLNRTEGSLGKLIEKIKNKEIPHGSFLIVESLDRLSRDKVTQQLSTFLEILRNGVNIVTLFDDTVHSIEKINEAPMSLVMAFTVMIRANEESETKSKRLKAAWSAKRQAAVNQTVMTKIVPMWLTVQEGVIQEIPSRSKVVREIFADCISGLGKRAIAKKLNSRNEPVWGSAKRNKSGLWNESYISKIIHNRAVLGEYQPHIKRDRKRSKTDMPIPDYFPRIVSEENFYLAKSKSSERLMKGGRNAPKAANLIRGLARCAECGSLLRFKDKGAGETYLQCARSDLKSTICNSQAINYRSVEKFLIETISHHHWRSLYLSSQELPTNHNRVSSIIAQIQELESENYAYAKAIIASGESSTIMGIIQGNEKKIKELNDEIESLKTNEAKQKDSVSLDESIILSKLFNADRSNLDQRRRIQSLIANRVESIHSCKNSKGEIGIAVLMRSKKLLLASINIQDATKSFKVLLEPWQLRPESRRIAIYYEVTIDRNEEHVAEPKIFEMPIGFNPISEFLSAKAYENFQEWGIAPQKNDFPKEIYAKEMEKFKTLRDSFMSNFPIATIEKFDGSPVLGIFSNSKELRSIEACKRSVESDFYDRSL